MQRVILTLPIGNGIPIFGYGLFIMVGFLAALFIARVRAKAAGVSKEAVIDLGLISIFTGIIGARLAFLLLDYTPSDGQYGNWREWLAVWEGGLTFQGGLFLALLADWIYLRYRKISVGKMFDIYAPGLAIGVGFGRLGCLLNGCCWGKPAPAGSVFSMRFPDAIEPMAHQLWLAHQNPSAWTDFVTSLGYPADTLPTVPIYATQIISALGLFAIGAGLMWAERRFRPRRDGQVIVWFLLAYAIGRFVIEFWRDDTPLRYGFGAFPGLRLGQWLAVAMFVVGVILQWYLSRRKT
ncbi:MAG: prolipoprotein diacylglyceryl transferase [Planctomycetaceae bacterium]|nr:prolipoprotein diacylglyceryl transferase [Planctomycetaceae bacterium]